MCSLVERRGKYAVLRKVDEVVKFECNFCAFAFLVLVLSFFIFTLSLEELDKLQRPMRDLVHKVQASLVLVALTLLPAALFAPLQRQLQEALWSQYN